MLKTNMLLSEKEMIFRKKGGETVFVTTQMTLYECTGQ